MEYYSDIRNNEFMKFLDKWMELETIILSEVTCRVHPRRQGMTQHRKIFFKQFTQDPCTSSSDLYFFFSCTTSSDPGENQPSP